MAGNKKPTTGKPSQPVNKPNSTNTNPFETKVETRSQNPFGIRIETFTKK